MDVTAVSVEFAGLLFVAMLALCEAGRRLGKRRAARDAEAARAGLGVIDGAVLSLLGLLIAFSFSGAASRFDLRRRLLVEEANAIGTAWLRLDLLPADTQPALRDLFRAYLDARLGVFRSLPDLEAAKVEGAHANLLQAQIWAKATAAVGTDEGRPWGVLVMGALNEMFDTATTHNMATIFHPPAIVFVMLGGLSLLSALLAGHGMAGAKRRSWVHILGFAAILAFTAYVILDLEFPRAGFIRIESADRPLIQLRESMK